MKVNFYCAKCGRSVDGNSAWVCAICKSTFCVGCHHDEMFCRQDHPEPIEPDAPGAKVRDGGEHE